MSHPLCYTRRMKNMKNKTDRGTEWGILLALMAFVVILATGVYIESI